MVSEGLNPQWPLLKCNEMFERKVVWYYMQKCSEVPSIQITPDRLELHQITHRFVDRLPKLIPVTSQPLLEVFPEEVSAMPA